MIRKFGAVFTGFAVMAMCIAVDAADDKTPTTKEIMKTLFKDGTCKKCAEAGKAEKWEDAQKLSKVVAECGAALAKNKCPKGDAESWAKLTKEFAEQTEALNKAAEAKDSAKFDAAAKAITGSCKACHDAHKGGKK